jgi:hypothetical protein
MNLRYDPYDYEYLKNEKIMDHMEQIRKDVLAKLSKLEILALDDDFDEFCVELRKLREEEKIETYFD